MALQAGWFGFPLKTGWVSFSIAMKFSNPMTHHTFHLMFFPVDIRLISINPSKIFHTHTSTMTAVTRLGDGWTPKELMSSKEASSPRSLSEDMATSTGGMALETYLVNSRLDRWPFLPCPLAHHRISSPKCSMETRFVSLDNLSVTGSAESPCFGGSRFLSFVCHLLFSCLIVSAVAVNTAKLSMRGF